MIITRTPFRISFAGGGSDLASFYKRREGCVISASINKYMYVIVHPTFNREETIVKYSTRYRPRKIIRTWLVRS